jgi:ABC-type antimicrobial peptide transport system permease subunit
LYGGLVVAQTALALGMATSAAFMMRATSRLASLEIGFNRAGLLEVQTTLLTEPHDSEIAARSFDEVLASVRSIPGVQGASWWSYVRVGGRYVEGYTEGGETHVLYNPRVLAVGADYLRVMGATMVKGRDFLPGDASGSPVAVIDERAARALFPYGSPIGRQVANIGVRGQSSFATVVGVVRTMRLSYSSFDVFDVGPGAVYVSTLPSPRMRTFLVRTTERALPNVMTKVVSRVETVAPNGTAVRAQRADWGKGRLEQGHEFLTHLFSAFALISLALSALGLYAILTYATIDRRREYAVRLSIGAAPREVFMRVLGEGFTLVLGGIALGEFVSFGASRLIDVFLLDLYHIDARTLVAADVMLLVVCVAAVLAPALRAMRTSPSELLRAQ